jgi:hypothetical protein
MIYPNNGKISQPGNHLVSIQGTSQIKKDFHPPGINPAYNILGTEKEYVHCEAIVVETGDDLGKVIDFDLPVADVKSNRTMIGKLASEIAPDMEANDLTALHRKPFVITLEENKYGRLKPKTFQKAMNENGRYRKL